MAETGYPSNHGDQPAPTYYSARPVYYEAPVYRPAPTRYVAVPANVPPPPRGPGWRDSDRDGIPNRYDRDRNNDGLPDRARRPGWRG